jgi:hypothetical protein
MVIVRRVRAAGAMALQRTPYLPISLWRIVVKLAMPLLAAP